ncbi:hypothetical protein QWM81_20125 [Streptomyces ficellus]|uniref:MmpS family membrane protein n=1 Tax=Streptomyces ficellus TaxID=1977088 RepID=A0ABT7ZA10_9ACTN|nr:hypothetical protein [Streptomyces ficellus]MDN3296330.1 hypothetical protein [Streptomyces ficellus]
MPATTPTEKTKPEGRETEGPEAKVAEVADADAPEGAGGRRRVGTAALLLVACGGLAGYGMFHTAEERPEPRAVPTAEVTYEVSGEGMAEVTYLVHSELGTATVDMDATFPWKKTVRVPLGKAPTVAITLGESGGQAACDLAVRGQHVQRATAEGAFGRASCTGPRLVPQPR